MEELIVQLEIEDDKKDLRKAGLTDVEIEGYIEFFLDHWFSPEGNSPPNDNKN